jgi:hypothetical protein
MYQLIPVLTRKLSDKHILYLLARILPKHDTNHGFNEWHFIIFVLVDIYRYQGF